MPQRDQLTEERLEALITVLEDDGTIDPDVAEVLRCNREFGDCQGVDRLQAYKDGDQ